MWIVQMKGNYMRNFVYWIVGIGTSLLIIHWTDDFLLLSFSAIVFTLPLFLMIEVVYIVISYLLKRKVYLVLSWSDLPTICFSIAAWGYIDAVKPMAWPCKSLANHIEPAIFTTLACFMYAIRCYYAFKGNLERMEKWKIALAVTIPIVAILFAFLFPGLPE